MLVALPGLESIGIAIGDLALFSTGLTLAVLGILASRGTGPSTQASGSV
jgi:hypothetical protein